MIRSNCAAIACESAVVAQPNEPGEQVAQLARGFRHVRDIELSLHVAVVGDGVAPFMTAPGTEPAPLRAVGSLAVLPGDRGAAVDEILRRREELGFSYFVIGAHAADALAPVVAELAGS